ncbi:hypothetical protein ACWDTT_15800 [Streptosporangium sandarakinum]
MSEYKYAALVREIVDEAPPLTAGQKARIAVLMRGAAPVVAEAPVVELPNGPVGETLEPGVIYTWHRTETWTESE